MALTCQAPQGQPLLWNCAHARAHVGEDIFDRQLTIVAKWRWKHTDCGSGEKPRPHPHPERHGYALSDEQLAGRLPSAVAHELSGCLYRACASTLYELHHGRLWRLLWCLVRLADSLMKLFFVMFIPVYVVATITEPVFGDDLLLSNSNIVNHTSHDVPSLGCPCSRHYTI